MTDDHWRDTYDQWKMSVFYGPETADTRRCEHGKRGDEYCAHCAAPDGHFCGDCKWFNGGECHRFPPAWVSWPNDNQHPVIYFPQSSWPTVGALNWCGEWSKAK